MIGMRTADTVLRSGETAELVCERAGLSEEARALLADGREPRAFVEHLSELGLYRDAIAFLAWVLPRREAVWWAWACAGDVAGEQPAPADARSLEATRLWIIEPTDANRRAAMAAAEATNFDSPAGMAGFAAFLCGDNLAPADAPAGVPAIPPDPSVAPRVIGGCICLAAAILPEGVADRFRSFLKRGLEMADKRQVWTAPARPGQEG